MGAEQALNEISMNSGRLYDEDVSQTCLKLFREENFDFREQSTSAAAE